MTKKIYFITLLVFCCQHYILGQQFDYSPGFKAGKPDKMDVLSFLEGEWDINLFYPSKNNSSSTEWISYSTSKSIFNKKYSGTFIIEDSDGFPINPKHEGFSNWKYHALFSYDRFNKYYRVIYFDNILGLSDIYEGKFTNTQTLVLSNINTQTYNNQGKNHTPQKGRLDIIKINDNTFELIWFVVDKKDIIEYEIDRVPWVPIVKMVYKKHN